MKKQFPKYEDHADVVCFKCSVPVEPICFKTENAAGDGGWRAACPKCQMFTWYDLER